MVRATGTPARLHAAFGSTFARVTFRGTEYTGAIDAPTLPAAIAPRVAAIHGLQPYLRPHKHSIGRKAAVTADGLYTNLAPPYKIDDIKKAYNVDASALTGAGQSIAIIIDTIPLDSDLTAFWTRQRHHPAAGHSLCKYSCQQHRHDQRRRRETPA